MRREPEVPARGRRIRKENAAARERSSRNHEAWDRVLLSRRKDRPAGRDYIEGLFADFMEFHGDRCFKDDGAIWAVWRGLTARQ